jgi:recombinational DNA repair protein (RecF pathway)
MAEPKLATCCYCGARTVLVPTAREGHALACASCGAPVTRMKALRPEPAARAAAHPMPKHPKPIAGKREKPKKRKKRKGLLEKLMAEIRDGIEDILD